MIATRQAGARTDRADGAQRAERSPEIVIRPVAPSLRVDARELWRYRHLLGSLIERNVRTQFDAMHLGFIWACARPVLYVVVFTWIRHLSDARTGVDIPYPLYVYSGLIVWWYILDATRGASNALRSEAGLMQKVYYPRLLAPVVPVVANLTNFGISLVPMLAMLVWYGVSPGLSVLLLPVVLLQCMALVFGLGLVFASLSLEYRDWDRFLYFSLYLGMFVSPVIYAPSMIPDEWQTLYLLNPMAGTLLAFRGALFAPFAFPYGPWLYSLGWSMAVLLLGVWLFRRTEIAFADKL